MANSPVLQAITSNQSCFCFLGSARQYFGVWIVSVVLTFITLGFYAPWAKARRLRYLYGHTQLLTYGFNFTGIPHKMLKSRIIALIFYLLIVVLMSITTFAAVGLLCVVVLIPWMQVASLRFYVNNTTYNNFRFCFRGSLLQNYKLQLKNTVAVVLSFGFALPYAVYQQRAFTLNHVQVGHIHCQLNAAAAGYFRLLFVPIATIIGLSTCAVALITLYGAQCFEVLSGTLPRPLSTVETMVVLTLLVLLLLLFLLYVLVSAIIFKYTWSQLSVGKNRVSCNLSLLHYMWVVITNNLLTVASFGLATPWAQIRLHKIKIESLNIYWANDPSQYTLLAATKRSALGAEVADMFDIEMGF